MWALLNQQTRCVDTRTEDQGQCTAVIADIVEAISAFKAIGIVTRTAKHVVLAAATDQNVVAFLSEQVIVAAIAEKHVVTGTGLNVVVTRATTQGVLADIRQNGIVASISIEDVAVIRGRVEPVLHPVRTVATMQFVAAGFSEQGVIATVTIECVVTGDPDYRVIAIATTNIIIAFSSEDTIVT
ncbi:hypothetical protein A9G05_13135 [Pseudomonas sp. ENNP23]|nr:hypothetical protein A9G05_13135 [Pseudomonas sp. ENNP23]